MSVTLSEVKRAARAHRAPLAGESAGYLVLAIADQVLQAPRLVQAADIQLTEEGSLRVVSGHASSDEEAELSLRLALDQLLLVASSGSAALTRAGRRTTPLGLSSLVRELEAALIPVNRSAARRALARVHRETARALQSGSLPEEEEPRVATPVAVVAPATVSPVATPVLPVAVPVAVATAEVALPVLPPAAPPDVALREPNPEPELAPDCEQDLETPWRLGPLPPMVVDSQLNGVVSALCEELPAPPQFVESDALTSALPVRALTAPEAEPEPEFLLDIEIEFETDAVDSSAAPTVMRALEVGPVPVALADTDAGSEQPLLDAPLEARTRPEPVVLRKTLRPVPVQLPEPIEEIDEIDEIEEIEEIDEIDEIDEIEALPHTPTLGSLATQLPILPPEQIAEMSVAASRVADLLQSSLRNEDRTERMPEVLPLSPGLAMVESKKSDVNELVSSFQVAQIAGASTNQSLRRAIKEMADLDLTPAPFAGLIR